MSYSIYTYGDLMTLQDFVDSVKITAFTDWDGSGYYCDGVTQNRKALSCKDIYKGIVDTGWSHVVWYNK